MKKLSLIFTLFFVSLITLYSQQDWNTMGNTTFGGAWLGTLNSQPLQIRTNNTFRYGVTAAGRFGINTTQPDMLFHVADGGLLVSGTLQRK